MTTPASKLAFRLAAPFLLAASAHAQAHSFGTLDPTGVFVQNGFVKFHFFKNANNGNVDLDIVEAVIRGPMSDLERFSTQAIRLLAQDS